MISEPGGDKIISPLDRIKVLDWTIMQQGPATTEMLGDLGAEVIKIEEKDRGDPGRGLHRVHGASSPVMAGGRNFYFETFNRNKRSIALDLGKEQGREIIYKLVESTDVFVQNFRLGVAERLGLDYATLYRYNPRLIYAHGLGFGRQGPDTARPAYDIVAQATSGFLTQIGEPGMTPQSGPPGMSDQMGATILALGILAALFAREKTGLGQEVYASLLGSTIWLEEFSVSYRLLLGQDHPRQHSRSKRSNPLWNFYRCKDNSWISLCMMQSDRFWHDFCLVLGIEALEHEPKFENADKRMENCEELVAILDKVFASKTREEWMGLLRKGNLVYGAVNTVSQVVEDPQVIENDYIVDFDHPALGKIKLVGSPLEFSKMSSGPRLPAPELGEHTEEILLEVGYTWDDIIQLKNDEVI